MAYNPINSNEIESGEPVKSGSLAKVRDNFNDHEERIVDLESGSNVTYPPLIFRVNGYYGDQGPATGWVKHICNFNMQITGARLYIDKAGTSGTTTIDIKYKRGTDAYSSIFLGNPDSLPAVSYNAGDDAVASGSVRSFLTLQAGDILRLDTTTVQTDGHSFTVRIDYIKT